MIFQIWIKPGQKNKIRIRIQNPVYILPTVLKLTLPRKTWTLILSGIFFTEKCFENVTYISWEGTVGGAQTGTLQYTHRMSKTRGPTVTTNVPHLTKSACNKKKAQAIWFQVPSLTNRNRWIRICTSYLKDPDLFVTDLQDATKKKISKFFCLVLFEGTVTSFFTDKRSNRSHITEIKGFLTFFAWSWKVRIRIHPDPWGPKNLWIRIRNTAVNSVAAKTNSFKSDTVLFI